eukprot:CAMPEP_0176281030 /NCGR_PEP_ID=MMETSP0121_2-20121125/50090_1 /TAXON_ID=160619 /ORGANISM="Kryptoperidinium foliaceum, Strain CCMP 1326" /LENGTH=197 /DNA_ID=CAMNT_0017621363 /DNA_START=154 /DNA_END=745 /DNA_ORIENTATION=-
MAVRLRQARPGTTEPASSYMGPPRSPERVPTKTACLQTPRRAPRRLARAGMGVFAAEINVDDAQGQGLSRGHPLVHLPDVAALAVDRGDDVALPDGVAGVRGVPAPHRALPHPPHLDPGGVPEADGVHADARALGLRHDEVKLLRAAAAARGRRVHGRERLDRRPDRPLDRDRDFDRLLDRDRDVDAVLPGLRRRTG